MAKPIHVLFVDEDGNVLDAVQRLFAQEPYAVYTTTSVERAMEVLQKENIKVVVSDRRTVSGVHFLQNVKQLYPDAIRILFAAHSDFRSAEEAVNDGEVYRFISKPWKDTALLNIIRRAIDHYDLIVRAEETNQKLKVMYEVQREFTSTVSHELRTPLASIKTAIDLVIKKTLGSINEEQEEVLGRAKKNVDRLKRLIDDILDLTKMESGKLQMNFATHDLHWAIRDVVDAQKDVAHNRGLYIKTVLDSHIPQITFDSDRIVQVLNNIVGNALKFTKHGGITIKTKDKYEENFVLVSVIDTGKGIAEDELPKLFQKFHQVESAAQNEEGGTGLGLAICKEIINSHRGKIWIESELEKGTTFHFTLPRQQGVIV